MSVSETVAAVEGPLFVVVTVYVTFVPAVTVAGPVLVTARSAIGVTVVPTFAELLDESVSKSSDETVAVFEIVVVLPGLMTRLNCADAPLGNLTTNLLTLPFTPTPGFEHDAAGPVFCGATRTSSPAAADR